MISLEEGEHFLPPGSEMATALHETTKIERQ